MKVLVTGAGGNLARVVVPALAAAGHTPRLLDFRPIDTAHQLLQGDVRNPDDLASAVEASTPSSTVPLSTASIAATGRPGTSGRSTWTAPSTSTRRRRPPRSPGGAGQ